MYRDVGPRHLQRARDDLLRDDDQAVSTFSPYPPLRSSPSLSRDVPSAQHVVTHAPGWWILARTASAECEEGDPRLTRCDLARTSCRSGDVAALGSWDTSKAVALDASKYTSANPLWTVTVNLAPGSVASYKFIKVAGSTVTWEADPNHTLTVPCSATTVASSWQT